MRPLPVPANDDPMGMAAALQSRSAILREIITDQRWSAGVRAAACSELEKVSELLRQNTRDLAKMKADLLRRLRRLGQRPREV